ncbi:GNAT family N-acetyltransferase [Aquimarina addita]|uniref:GNAT family N-acetyltransferase n=1 Tax=Aquimarina addita TaxID=870485 RepID=A0ABP7XC71_9FLAO
MLVAPFSEIKIQPFDISDWSIISVIYQEGIDTKMATFETKIPTWEQWDLAHAKSCRLKAIMNNKIVGWAALSPISKRQVYKGVGEVSIYILSKYRNQGIGKSLLSALISESEKVGFWSLQASIFNTNKASLQLHTSMGFRIIGYKEKIGKLDDIWYDNTILEKRSNYFI